MEEIRKTLSNPGLETSHLPPNRMWADIYFQRSLEKHDKVLKYVSWIENTSQVTPTVMTVELGHTP